MRDARCRVAPKRAISRVVEVHAVREPDVVAEPAELLEVLDRPHAEQLEAERLLLDGLGHVRVQADAALAGERGRLAPSARWVTLNGEHGASAIRHIDARRRVVEARRAPPS